MSYMASVGVWLVYPYFSRDEIKKDSIARPRGPVNIISSIWHTLLDITGGL